MTSLIKAGLKFTTNLSDYAFSGDLHFDVVMGTWSLKFIECSNGDLAPLWTIGGPEPVDLLLVNPIIKVLPDKPYATCNGLGRIIASEKFMVWMEEHTSNIEAVYKAHRTWEFKPDLHWVRSK